MAGRLQKRWQAERLPYNFLQSPFAAAALTAASVYNKKLLFPREISALKCQHARKSSRRFLYVPAFSKRFD
jgi:hypothetical protein